MYTEIIDNAAQDDSGESVLVLLKDDDGMLCGFAHRSYFSEFTREREWYVYETGNCKVIAKFSDDPPEIVAEYMQHWSHKELPVKIATAV